MAGIREVEVDTSEWCVVHSTSDTLRDGGVITQLVKEVILMVIPDAGVNQAAVAQVRNLVIQRHAGCGKWENWCGPTTKEIADYYLTEVAQLVPDWKFRVINLEVIR